MYRKPRLLIRASAISLAFLALAGCNSSDDAEPAESEPPATGAASTVPSATEAPTSTVAATTTDAPATTFTTSTTSTTSTTTTSTTVASTTTESEPTGRGVIWASTVDDSRVNVDGPAPTWMEGALTWSIDLVLDVEAGSDTELQRACREEARLQSDFEGDPLADSCLVIQVAFDVAADATDEAAVYFTDAVTPEGQQISFFGGDEARPGTVNNGAVVIVPGAVPGSRTYWDIQGGLGASSYLPDFEWVVPGPEFFQPIYFD